MKKLFTLACMVLPIVGVSMAQVRLDSLSKTSQNYKKTKAVSPASKVSLNPQPLPPGERKAGADPASKVSLNPQPLPPKQGKIGSTSAASKVSLNPQPLPPKQAKVGATSAASKVSLNPQPLPPKQGNAGASQKAFTGDKAGKKAMQTGPPIRQR